MVVTRGPSSCHGLFRNGTPFTRSAATGSNTELLGTLGVDTIINYREQDWGEKLAG